MTWSTVLSGEIDAVHFDRDGTLIHDVPYNGDPARVRLVDSATEAMAALRASGVAAGVIANQSGTGSAVRAPSEVDGSDAVRRLVGQRCAS